MENNASNLREALWRRPPTGEELRAQSELGTEARLTEALAKISDVPVPSNFTARVWSVIDLDEQAANRRRGRTWNWRRLFPRLAVATAGLLLVGVLVERHETNAYHQEIARSVAMVARANALPSVEALENLEAIQRIGQSARADGDLLAVMQ